MTHFRNRDDVIKWAVDHIPKQYKSIARSFEEGKVEFLGGFKYVPYPRWIIKATSKFNKVHYVSVFFDKSNRIRLSILTGICWKCWDGDGTNNPLYQGDYPERYKELKDEATKEYESNKDM